MSAVDSSLPTRRVVYALLIVLAAGQVAGRILSVSRVYEPDLSRPLDSPNDPRGPWPKVRPEPMPTHGDNDRSRWDTVRALVDQGTYAIGSRYPGRISPDNQYGDQGIITEDGWKTIDKVLDPETHKFYSSKPPFLPTLLAGEYWLLKKTLGWSITEQRFLVVRTVLFTINWLPFVIFLILLARLAEELGTTDWGRIFVVACGGFATLMIPFATTLNNHTIAASTALFALYPVLRMRPKSEIQDSKSETPVFLSDFGFRTSDFLLAGFFAGFTACSELPATSFLVSLFLVLCWQNPKKALELYLPAAAIPIAFFFLTNYWAIGQLKPAYSEFGGPWYEYQGSHWLTKPGETPHGIDFASVYENQATYAFHLLIGHHGLFSLTPIFLLGLTGALAGLVGLTRGRASGVSYDPGTMNVETGALTRPARQNGIIAGLTLTLLVIVIGFYVLVANRNYGGWTAGPRWLIWLTPFFLLAMLPAVDWLAPRRWGRILAYVLLAISVISASYPAWNPWRHPWLYNGMEKLDWIKY